ncbi:MAG TPA: hypothetical protein VJ505_13445 [Holophagaceae bacterium]|nr:hypothetical protein [Holophagaceae bacterium]
MLKRSFLSQSALAFGFAGAFLACGGGAGSTSSPATPAAPGPHLSTAPSPQAGYVGDVVTYRVAADGSGNSFQWLKNGTAIPSATTDTLVLPVVAGDDQARISVRVTGSTGGITTSPDAILDVLWADPAVLAGHDHALAITTKGRVYAWGVGGNGQLGQGDWQARTTPTLVNLPAPAVQVAAGWGHSLALLNDGRVFSWGANTKGQLGDGTINPRNVPAAVGGLTNVVYLIAGYDHNLAVKQDNSVWVWGYNSHGQLGLGDKVDRTRPTLSPLNGAALNDVALGALHSLVLSGTAVYGCGDNGYGQLGFPYSPTAEHLSWTSLGVAARAIRTNSLYSTLIYTNGVPYGTGENVYGPLGDGSLTTRYGWVAMSTAGLSGNLTDVVPGQYHTLLLGDAGTAAVGYNWYGQLGLGAASTTSSTSSQAIPGLTVLQASANYASSYAMLANLTVKAWGYNNNGRLGDGTSTDHAAPTLIPGLFLGPIPTGVTPPPPVAPGFPKAARALSPAAVASR